MMRDVVVFDGADRTLGIIGDSESNKERFILSVCELVDQYAVICSGVLRPNQYTDSQYAIGVNPIAIAAEKPNPSYVLRGEAPGDRRRSLPEPRPERLPPFVTL